MSFAGKTSRKALAVCSAAAQEKAAVEITCIANEGLMISRGGKKF